ncbi:hypothetical protein Cadr_000003082 [Camelus dromedarius]|uniref:Uncharacterized protein n=1 Tax=Camelus dromedarius TaxID=9838 RepID=A0A5N4C1B9_CAMDR|nr:hypothetical protein Cadr_000003082 [Camelus dromedarius]
MVKEFKHLHSELRNLDILLEMMEELLKNFDYWVASEEGRLGENKFKVRKTSQEESLLLLVQLCSENLDVDRYYRDLTMGLSTSAIWKNTGVEIVNPYEVKRKVKVKTKCYV